MKRKVVGIIPARFSSQRLPGKPLLLIRGRPMIWHVYTRLAKAHILDELIVATDDKRIMEAVAAFGGKACLTSINHPSGTDRVEEAASRLRLRPEDIIVNIQGDEPMLKSGMIEELIEPFLKDKNVVMATLIHRVSFLEAKDKNVVKVVFDQNRQALYFSRSLIPMNRLPLPQKAASARAWDRVFWKHLGFYAYTYNFLKKFTRLPQGKLEKIEKLEQLRALEYGYEIKVVKTRFDTLSVDTISDLSRVRQLMK